MKMITESYHGKVDIYKVVLVSIFIFFTLFRLYNALTAGLMYDEPETLFNAEQIYLGKLPFVDYFEHHPIVSSLADRRLCHWDPLPSHRRSKNIDPANLPVHHGIRSVVDLSANSSTF